MPRPGTVSPDATESWGGSEDLQLRVYRSGGDQERGAKLLLALRQ